MATKFLSTFVALVCFAPLGVYLSVSENLSVTTEISLWSLFILLFVLNEGVLRYFYGQSTSLGNTWVWCLPRNTEVYLSTSKDSGLN